MKNQINSSGQTLLEVIVVIAVGIIIVGVLVFATIFSLRNANSAKTNAQATKLAQEGLEKVRISRDRSGTIAGFPPGSWVDATFWSTNISVSTCIPPQNCYFKLDSGDLLYNGSFETPPLTQGESIGNFTRFIILSDDGNFASWKIVESVVSWSDFSGLHQSRVKTVLRKL
ncbi:hypothetical protein A3F00_05035 [Candidatus Daviesbacteria bacterium RIFCSPHIGHO2_12_FULL_37_11]|uniref:Type II secretion system protein n=1 Tax=Candidatus Daviesbacteria bacterium RIFCSPHIGHO2_12_FULL_37_11 TaxID=1797777 RepID=A0A1F5K9A3_9BACT|nr:MAG: hypothetical protein A2111_03530 [Candidatus Daviesbacteria bacterium GWA1_38_6]OGE37523.1 MAG: hypothetical protein A3F00_05035 [Candidatus Daviesbacteria bacterium RIFCSPHIGHO2_12_FULL_37_11]OGE45900.1 MAG: hypothetical protein A3B39_01705 [Candidatus Daviesbacteria bacterium RIFCSPLOWO2_01_FULL_37_10]